MRLISAQVLGFQSFRDSGNVEFAEGINLLVGQNNVGKSALLRALQPTLIDDRHRTPEQWEDFRLAPPEVKLVIEVSGSELRREFLQAHHTFIPIPEDQDLDLFVDQLLSKPRIPITVTHRPNATFSTLYPGYGRDNWQGTGQPMCAVLTRNGGEFQLTKQYRNDNSTGNTIYMLWQRQMFYFSAERMNIGQSAADNMQRLNHSASNLPAVLLTLNGDRGDLFQKLVRHLREVFPTVGNVSVRPVGGNVVEIRVWPTEAMQRVELSFPLMQSGTGVSQVLAILAAVMTVDDAVLIIDEINSFLHPAAVKALLRILQTEYANHQYIISTHAPDVIGFSNPQTIHLVKRNGYESSINKLNLQNVAAFREVADHLGVSMADVFAADRVIWVEGPTEELCFPLLYQHAVGRLLPRGTIFTSVMATGDFMAKRRDKELVYQIYQRLSKVAVPLVVSVAFSFDNENLSDAEQEKMVRDSQRTMHFLPRRHIECYLINPSAIATFVTEKDTTLLESVNADIVTAKLKDLASADQFKIAEWKGDINDATWLRRVDAANIIADVCAQLSNHQVTFNKKNDTLTLLQRVQLENPAQIHELAQYVQMLVEAFT